ncbi:hypothetical protein [Clostridium estertheticum]|uniref:Tetratricopeptide repeat protein n=1 Tax=Clostridium estertheticum TaxID=238834 RepID=A0AA47I7W0_9CLOT|nr:hypothetical protein [Clostridium estertheticum]MBU3155201.1 hypothetical protein [Clostridium estertheticum]WAG61255.1 hypothetical protein LL038_03105 [Clostridium estertheticum]
MKRLLFIMNKYINTFKEMEISLQYSRISFIRKNRKKLVEFFSLLIFTYILAAIIYVCTLILPVMCENIKIFFWNIAQISTPHNTIKMKMYIPSLIVHVIDFKQFLIIFVIILVIVVSLMLFHDDREIIKEFDVLYSIMLRIYSNVVLKKRHLYIYIFYTIAMIVLSIGYTSVYFVLLNLIQVMVFWTSIFIVMLVYGSANGESLKVKKIIIFFILTPIIVISLFKNSIVSSYNPLTTLVLLVSAYLAFDRLTGSYMELRKEVYEGKSLYFMINSFSTNDFDKLWKIVKVNSIDEIIDDSDYMTVGLTAFKKSINDINLAKACFKKCIEKDQLSHIAIYFNAIICIEHNPQEAVCLLDRAYEIQEKGHLEVTLYDINLWKVEAMLKMKIVDYKKIIKLIVDQYDHTLPRYIYVLGSCYVKISEFSKAKRILSSLYYDENTFSDIPYLLAIIEFETGENNVRKVMELINIAENFNNDCEELKNRLEAIQK